LLLLVVRNDSRNQKMFTSSRRTVQCGSQQTGLLLLNFNIFLTAERQKRDKSVEVTKSFNAALPINTASVTKADM
jgi:hypothetical protein